MPCSGPNLKAARERGNRYANAILPLLMKEEGLWDVTHPDFRDFHLLPNARERWDRAKADFVRAMEELFVQDSCNSF